MQKLYNIYYYIQGYTRYYLYYSRFSYLLFSHIRVQIRYRISSMDNKCYNSGSCKICGCKTTALQMCNKACDKPCYPEILSRSNWNRLVKKESCCSKLYIITDDSGKLKGLCKNFVLGNGLVWILDGKKFKLLNNGS